MIDSVLESLMFVYMYVLFYIGVETNFADFEEFCGLMGSFLRNH